MTETELLRIEQELSVALPGVYRSILSRYPDELLELSDLLKDEDNCDPETPADLELLNDPETIIEMNKFVRDPSLRYTESGGPWPASYLLIGMDGCGDYYAVDLIKGDESPVFFWDHDLREWEVEVTNIRDYVPHLVEQYYEFAREEGYIE